MATQTLIQLPVRTRVTVTYQGRETQGQITAKSTDWAADVLLLGLAATITIQLPWSKVSKNEYRCFTAIEADGVMTITEVEPRNDHSMNWMSGHTSREGAWAIAGARGLKTVFVGRDGSSKDLGVVFSPKAFEHAAYQGYVAYGRSMSDGYYAPLTFESWVKSFRRSPDFNLNDASEAVKAALPKYIAALAQAGIR
jgi:hypothetical protein